MTHYLNLRGYTWQKCLRTWWWRLLLMGGLLVVFWRGTPHELFVAVVIALAVGWREIIWNKFARYVWQGWRSK
jgi:hypothetical protein